MYPELAGFAVDAACLSALGIADYVTVVVCVGGNTAVPCALS